MSGTPIPRLHHGIDITEVERIREAMSRGHGFEERVFTEGERAYCNKMAHPAIHFAARFAAKEATLKALGLGLGAIGIARSLQDIETKREEGPPRLKLRGKPKAVAESLGVVQTVLSITHTDEHAIASVVMMSWAPPEGDEA